MIEEVKLEDGKYTFRYDTETAELICLRYGERWRNFVGDKAVFSLFVSYYDLQKKEEQRKTLFQRLLNKVNKVTASWRSRGEIIPNDLTALSNRQIDVEEALRALDNE